MDELKVSRPTASSYLNYLGQIGLIKKMKLGRDNYYVNENLFDLLINEFHDADNSVPPIESVG